MKKLILFAMLFFSLVLHAQPGKEAWHWYFGTNSAIDFSSGAPISVMGIPGGYFDGSASVSDANTGQYLFSVGGIHIYNKNNLVMSNGYNIFNAGYTQAVIVLKPGTNNLFYVFTPDRPVTNSHGVTYSIVDMSLNGGLGAVTAIKNKRLLAPPATEKVAAVRHCNGVDYWIIVHPANSNAYHSYLLSSAGLDTIPVISNTGVVHQYKHFYYSYYIEGMGCLKASPNGKKLASAIPSDSIPVMELFDFDNSTGVVSNPLQFNYPGFGPFGISFSPDNTKLYSLPNGGSAMHPMNRCVYQYDLSSGAPAIILASQTLIYLESTVCSLSEMQMAPDGKIYISRYANDTLAIIHNPNLSGVACNFQYEGMKMNGYNSDLPNFNDANKAGIQINIPNLYLCSSITTGTLDAGTFTNYQWSTGATTQTISVNSPGQYWVTVTNDQGCTRTDTMSAYVVQGFSIDTVVCDSFHADVTQAGATQYVWYDSTSNPIKNISQSGNYYVDVTFQGGCLLRDSITTAVISSPHVDLGPPISLCDFKLGLNAYYPGTSIHWSTGATTSSITVNQPGTYWVTLLDTSGCIGSDTLVISPPWQLTNLNMPNIVTPNGDKINDEIDFAKFEFYEFTITIYNRWGQKIFESNSVDGVWKPTVDDGTYFYTAQYKIDCGTSKETKTLKGFITVVR